MGGSGSRFKARPGRCAHSRVEKMSHDTMWDPPDEVLVHILSFLPVEDIARAASACSQWARVLDDRRVWRGKSYLYLSGRGQGLAEALLVARALPILKRVSIYTRYVCNIYLTGESAEFQVPNLHDNEVRSVISSLVTESLSIDFGLLGDTPSNCLVVQPHRLKQLEVGGYLTLEAPDKAATEAKLRALAGALSQQLLPDLQSADIDTGGCFLDVQRDVYHSDVLAALVTCCSLDRIAIQFPCYLSWSIFTKFSKLQALQLAKCGIQIPESLFGNLSAQWSKVQVLELKGCELEDIRFLDLCPQLRNLSIIGCRPLRSRELSRKSELRSLLLRNLDVGPEFLEVLCPACPQLQSVVLDFCRKVGHTQPLGHCSQLSFLEVRGGHSDNIRVVGLPSELKHLRLETNVTSDQLAEIVQRLPHLELLDIANSDVGSLHFLCHCAGLTQLSLAPACLERVSDFHELGGLRNVQKLSLTYRETNFGPLTEALGKVSQLETLEVKFRFSSEGLPDLSFLRHCRQLHSLTFQLNCSFYTECQGLHELVNQKELRKVGMDNLCFSIEAVEGVLPSMPHLQELHIGLVGTECDFSFLSHCPQLTSLSILFVNVRVCHFAQLRRLEQLRRLVLERLPDRHLSSLVEEVRRMPQLEYLDLGRSGHNFLESWECRRLLSMPRS